MYFVGEIKVNEETYNWNHSRGNRIRSSSGYGVNWGGVDRAARGNPAGFFFFFLLLDTSLGGKLYRQGSFENKSDFGYFKNKFCQLSLFGWVKKKRIENTTHTQTHTHARARAHARTHARTHTHTHTQKNNNKQTGEV